MGKIHVSVVRLSDDIVLDSDSGLTRKETNMFKRYYRDKFDNETIKFIEDELDDGKIKHIGPKGIINTITLK